MINLFDDFFDNNDCGENDHTNVSCCTIPNMRVGYTYVPNQVMQNTYSPEKALIRGTIFPELDIPMKEYGKQYANQEANNGK